jgi:hypothetical protein
VCPGEGGVSGRGGEVKAAEKVEMLLEVIKHLRELAEIEALAGSKAWAKAIELIDHFVGEIMEE